MAKYEFEHHMELPLHYGRYITFTDERKKMNFDLFLIKNGTRLLNFEDGVAVFIDENGQENVTVASNNEFTVKLPSNATGKILIDFLSQEGQ